MRGVEAMLECKKEISECREHIIIMRPLKPAQC